MPITAYPAAAFLRDVQALLEREAANNLMLGLALRLAQLPAPAENLPYLAAVHDDEGIAIAALMTWPHNLAVYSDWSARRVAGPSAAGPARARFPGARRPRAGGLRPRLC